MSGIVVGSGDAMKKPNRRPNAQCQVCGAPFYAQPSIRRVTCSLPCRTEYYRNLGTLLTGGQAGELNHRWKGGRWLHQGRYWLVLNPEHPFADRHGYVREHRLVMEAHLGRSLEPQEVVHHRNHDTLDNRLENLELFASNREHKRTEHRRGESPLTRGKRCDFSETPSHTHKPTDP